MNAVVETVIATILAPYLEGVSRENLKVGLFSGRLLLKNLSVKPTLLTQLKLHRCSFESASVGSLSLSVPWKSLRSGKIEIELSDVVARIFVNPGSSVSKRSLLAMKRDLIDEIKAKLLSKASVSAESLGGGIDTSNENSFAAKLIRRLIRSLIINVRSIQITLVLASSGAVVEDEEGFVDASEELLTERTSDDCEVSVKIASVSLRDSDMPIASSLGKTLEVCGISLAVFPTGKNFDYEDPTILPPSDLLLHLSHDAKSGNLSATMTGLEACAIRITRSQMVLLKEALVDALRTPIEVSTIDMNAEARANYSVLYQAKDPVLKGDLDDLTLLFDAKAIAKCEHAVDQELLFTKEELPRSRSEIQELVESEEVGIPQRIDLIIDVGKNWTIKLCHDSGTSPFEVLLEGAKLVLDASISEGSGRIDASVVVTSGGFEVKQHGGNSFIGFSRRDSKKFEYPFQIAVNYLKESHLEPPHMDVIASISPITVHYEQGLFSSMMNFFSFVLEVAVLDSVIAQRERILKSGLELMESVKNSAEYKRLALQLMPTQIGITLDIAGPVVSLPGCPLSKERLVLSLGRMNLNQPKSTLNGSVHTEPATGLLERVSVTAVSQSQESIQVISPAIVDMKLQYTKENRLEISMVVSQEMACRVSPLAVRVVRNVVSIMMKEIDEIRTIQPSFRSGSVSMDESDVQFVPLGQEVDLTNDPFRIRVNLTVSKIDVVVNDGPTDSVFLQLSIPSACFTLEPASGDLRASLPDVRLVVRLANWEPLIEPAPFSLDCRICEETVQVTLSSRTINIVVSPKSIKLLERTFSSLLSGSAAPLGPGRYRLVNCSKNIAFMKTYASNKYIEVLPGDEFVELDSFLMPSGTRDLIISLDRSFTSESAVQVPLEKFFSASLSRSVLVHTLIPEHGQYRCVVISGNTFLINQCDVPLEISLPGHHIVTPPACLIGAVPFRETASVIPRSEWKEFGVLNPGCFVSVSVTEIESLGIRRKGISWMNIFTNHNRFEPSVTGIELSGEVYRLETRLRAAKPPLACAIHQVHIHPSFAVINNTPFSLRFKIFGEFGRVDPWKAVPLYTVSIIGKKVQELRASIGFDSDSTDWSNEIDSESDRAFLLSKDRKIFAPVHLTTAGKKDRELIVRAKWCLIDRTDLGLILFSDKKRVFDKINNVWLLPDPDKPVSVVLALGKDRWELTLPDNGHVAGCLGKASLVLISRETYRDKFVEIVPKFTIFNGLSNSLFVDKQEVRSQTGTPFYTDKAYLKVKLGDALSCKIPLKESAAGIWPLRIGKTVCRVEIAPLEGCVNVAFHLGSTVKVRNQKRVKPAVIFTDKSTFSIPIPPLSEKEIGWIDPFSHPLTETKMHVGTAEILVPLARAGDNVRHGGCVVVKAGEEPQSIVIVIESKKPGGPSPTEQTKVFHIKLEIDRIGLSLVREGKELLYAELALVRSLFKQENLSASVALLVSEIQVESCVTRHVDRPVILANTGKGVASVLEAAISMSWNVSKGVAAIPYMNIQLDSLFVEVDSEFMNAMEACLTDFIECTEEELHGSSAELSDQHTRLIVQRLTPLMQGEIAPTPVSTILILDHLQIGSLEIELWVDLSLESMRFLPVSLKLVISVLSFTKYFRLSGAQLSIKRRHISGFKGSSVHFVESLMYDYSFEAIKNMASLLGSSSLLRIPRAPIQLVTGVGAFGLESATKAVGGLGHLMSDLASDAHYRDSQRRIRKSKRIKGFADGFAEGVARLGEGAEGVFDIFKAPIQGAKKEGVRGFLKGVGKGLVGTVVKPITKVGEAVADVGTGIAKTFSIDSGKARDSFARKRLPRAFFGPDNEGIADYRELDSILFSSPVFSYGEKLSGMELIIPCTNGMAMIGFPEKLLFVQLVDPIEVLREMYTLQIDKVLCRNAEWVEIIDIFGITIRIKIDFPASPETKNFHSSLGEALSQCAAYKSGVIDWRRIRQAFAQACFATCAINQVNTTERGCELEVWEVERFLVTSGWRTPFLLLDSDSRWRWVDSKLKRHSKIDPMISRSQSAKASSPPIKLGELWKPLDEWKVVIDATTTDKEGWMYGISFYSSTWRRSRGITASVRKRKWVRNFV